MKAFHHSGTEAGYRANGEPAFRDHMLGYYAAHLLQPDGNNIEAINREQSVA